MPKINNLKTDILERKIDLAFLQEIWEQSENTDNMKEIETMLEIDGLQYISNPRIPNYKGTSYGGVAIIVNNERFTCERIPISVPKSIEALWCLVKPKYQASKFKSIVACCFYSPPDKLKNTKLADHIVTNLHYLSSIYPNSALILGADKNSMDISPIIDSGLKLRQMVGMNTHGQKIIDIIIMNTAKFYNSAVIKPPINPDNPLRAKPSDNSVPVCIPHTDRYNPPTRHYRIIKYRPLPYFSIRKFGEWITGESWDSIKQDSRPTDQVEEMQKLLFRKLDEVCPEKTMKVSGHDKPFMTAELKSLNRKKGREYCKRGKTVKYKKLKEKFYQLYKIEAQKYLNKTVDELKDSNPSRMYSI